MLATMIRVSAMLSPFCRRANEGQKAQGLALRLQSQEGMGVGLAFSQAGSQPEPVPFSWVMRAQMPTPPQELRPAWALGLQPVGPATGAPTLTLFMPTLLPGMRLGQEKPSFPGQSC